MGKGRGFQGATLIRAEKPISNSEVTSQPLPRGGRLTNITTGLAQKGGIKSVLFQAEGEDVVGTYLIPKRTKNGTALKGCF